MKRKYSVKELSTILGCSVTAVNKKIKPDSNNPMIRRYRNVFDTVIEEGVTYILLNDEELDQEKQRSKGFSNFATRGYTTPSNDDYIDAEPFEEEKREDRLLDFTERYINDLKNLYETYNKQLLEKDRQILLQSTSEKQKETEYLETKALNTTLTKRNNILTIALTVAVTLLITFATLFITVLNPKAESQAVEEAQPVQTVQETVKQPVKTVARRK